MHDAMHCKVCGKTPAELPEYVELAEDEGYASAEEACYQEEGTLNKDTGLFYCTLCYIRAGMPLGTA